MSIDTLFLSLVLALFIGFGLVLAWVTWDDVRKRKRSD